MTIAINTNLAGLSAQRQLAQTGLALGTALERLSSGLRINSAKDDAAGLAISQRLATQITGVNQATRNANDGISLAQTADGALASISSNLQRVRELAVQSANGTNSASDRAALQAEAMQLIAENDRVATQTEFNGTKLLDGSLLAQQFQVGANRQQTIRAVPVGSMSSTVLGTYNGFVDQPVLLVPGASSPLSVSINGSANAITLGTAKGDARDIASAINHGNVPGLTAVVDPSSVASVISSVGAVSGVAVMTINGIAIKVDYTAGSSAAAVLARRDAVIAPTNANTAATGVSAKPFSLSPNNGIEFYSLDGRTVTQSFNAGTATGSVSTDLGFGVGPWSSNVSLSYQAPVGTAVNSVEMTWAGINFGVNTVQSSGTALSNLDLSSVLGATAAIDSVDVALATVNATRATMGAMQNRFASTIANLQTSGEAMTASRSRIVDADFAQETANLSRAQILQQAGNAMVVQANQSAQGVMALLR